MNSAVPRQRVDVIAKRAPRRISVLGATGSVGASTIDLLRREPGRYAIEALTAKSNATALAKLARELGAKFAAVADEAAYAEIGRAHV